MVFGDSNSTAIPPCGGKPWPELLGERVGCEVVNRANGTQRMHAIRGERPLYTPIETYAVTVLEAAEQECALPDRVLLCAGTNDLPDSMPESEVEDWLASYHVLDRTLRERWDLDLRVVSILPMRVGGILSQAVFTARDARRVRANNRLRTYFGPTGRFFDADTVIGEGIGTSVQIWHPYVHDWGHINQAGHARLAGALPAGWWS